MPKQELDNEVKADLSVQASLEQRRDGITKALQDVANSHAKQLQALQTAQDKVIGNSALAGDQNVSAILANQRSQMESNQKSQVDLMNRALAAAGSLEKAGPEGPRRALQFINEAADLNGNVAKATEQQQATELEELRKISAISNLGQRNEQTEDLLRRQQEATNLLDRDMKAATAELERREALTENALNTGQLDGLRTIATETAADEKLRAIASLEQRRDGITNGLQDAANSHAKQLQALQTAQDKVIGNSALAGDQNVSAILANQRSQMESNQKSQVDLMNRALAAAGSLEKAGPEGPRRALQFINEAADLNGNVAKATEQQQATELEELRKISAISNLGQRNEQTEDLLRRQQEATNLLDRDMKAATAELERREALTENALNTGQLDGLRTIATETAADEKLRAILTDEVIQRLANEALCPGTKRLEDLHEDSAIQRVKGELAECLAAAQALEQIEQENKTRAADRQLFLVEGNRIREQGKKLSDGLIVWRDAEQKLQVWKALEVKSGPHAARELNYKIEKLSQEQDRELRKYALDAARDAVKQKEGLTLAQQRIEVERLAKEEEANLRSRKVQRQAGQREQTTERLDLTERIYVDGQAQQVAVDRERRLNDIVAKIATDDAIRKDLEAERLKVSSQELNRVAKAFVEELLRLREKQ